MDEYIFDMNYKEGNDVATGIGMSCRFQNCIRACVSEQLPHYEDMFPFLKGLLFESLYKEQYIILTASYKIHMSAVSIGTLKDDTLANMVLDATNGEKNYSYIQIKDMLGLEYMNYNVFTYFSIVKDGKISSEHFFNCIIDWLNDKILPVIFENNRKRVLDAIPAPPNFDMDLIKSNIFVLDDCSDNIDDLGTQGTCFYINNIGFITCSHVLTNEIQLFHANEPTKRYNLSIRKRNKDIDLAIFDVNRPISNGFEIGDSDSLSTMEHVAVVGFPKYQLGDKGFLSPGLITGFRAVSGIQRIVVNIPIVAGNSGGPVIDSNNRVIGIAVKGFSNGDIEPINEVIPINAIKYLN